MVLFNRSRVTAGLDIGSGFVKLVVMDHTRSEPEITRIAMSPLVPGAIVDGEVMDPVLVAEAVRGVVAEAGLKRKDVVAAVGGHDVIIKKIQMDRMTEASAREVIRWEAEQHVPFDMEGVQLDFQILDPDGDEPQMSVLLVAAKRELIDNRLGLLADAGLNATIIDVEAFALHNAFERSYPNGTDGLVALVNIGHEVTNLNLIMDGVPVLVRDIPFGSRRLREALQRERGLTAEQAEDVIQARTNAADLRGFVADRAEELAVAIERATATIIAQSGDRRIGRVFLSGGGARVPGMADAVGHRLGVRTEVANPLEHVAVRPEVTESVALEEVAPMLMLSVGLALRQSR
ncbi:MAG TPA: type IV pilus assembly protein PilM [Longimicrobiales bacterium]|nr:type IV pilus assembly protein PilM [Longimicrobiales bacterium]